MSGDWRSDVVHFWFALEPRQWWNGGPALDNRIRQNFLGLWKQRRELVLDAFLADPLTSLAAVILFDQFPRNMFRGNAEAYSTDHLALAIARDAIAAGFDKELRPNERKFLYMPFQHSEKLEDQNRALLLFGEIGDEDQLAYAKRHHDIIERFGRFPHRNAILGRSSRPEETAAAADEQW